MSVSSLTRRSVALLATTALITTGGAVTGLLVAPASATVSAISDVSPSGVANNGSTTFTITSGSGGFNPSRDYTVTLRRSPVVVGQGDVAGTPVDNTASCNSITSPPCGSTLQFTADLGNIAPGSYDVILKDTVTMTTATRSPGIGVASSGTPTVTGTALFAGTTTPPDGQLEITGDFLAKGSTVQFLLPDGAGAPGTVDPDLSFTPGVDGGTAESGYVSKTTLRGTYTMKPSFAAGRRYVRVVNTSFEASPLGSTSPRFAQPRVTSYSTGGTPPTQLGQGATTIPVTFTGNTFDATTDLFVPASGGKTRATDVTVAGPATRNADATTFTIPLSVSPTATTGTRTITVRSSDGAYVVPATQLTIAEKPVVSSITPSTRGQGFTGDVTLTGTGLSAATVFDLGTGITAVTKSATATPATATTAASTSAVVTLTIAKDAPTGNHSIKATNPDFGTSTLATGLSVTAAPVVTSITPPSGAAGSSVNVRLTGTGFNTSGLAISVKGPGTITATSPVTPSSSTTADSTFTIDSQAGPGLYDVTVTNTADGGTSTFVGGFGVNSLNVLTSPVSNSGTKHVVISGANLAAGQQATLTLPGNPAYQPAITVPVGFDSTQSQFFLDVPLQYASTGRYTVQVVQDAATLTCTACLQVVAAATPSITSVVPDKGGQGAVARQVTLKGTGFGRGQSVSFGAGTTTTSVTFDPTTPDTLVALVDIAPSATPGTRDVTVTNIGDPGRQGTKTAAFTVTAGPTVTAVMPAALGAGATNQTVTVNGTGFVVGATASFGPGVTVKTTTVTSATVLTAVVDVTSGAAPGVRDVAVTNPDGGRGVKAGGFTVNAAPVLTSVSPNLQKAGTTRTGVTFTGSGFATGLAFNIVGATVKNVVVVDATKATGDVVADAASSSNPPGSRTVFVINGDKGQSSLANGYTIATVPGPPTGVTATPGDATVTVSWTAPTGDAGTPLTGYTVSDGTPADDKTVGPDTTTVTFTGLTDGTSYTFSVVAVNGVGNSTPATRSATPFGVAGPPSTVTATGQDQQVVVTFGSGTANGKPITRYRVTTSQGSTFVKTNEVGAQSFAVVTGLTNGTTYTFTVAASNSDSAPYTYGAESGARAATPRFATQLSNGVAAGSTVAGNVRTVTGTLRRTRTGAAVAGATISLRLTPRVGSASTVTVTTGSTGLWTYTSRPTYTTGVTASFAGDTDDATSTAGSTISVATKITIASPRPGSTSSSATKLVVTGTTTPNKAGSTIYLYRYVSGKDVTLGSATVFSNGTYRISASLARGTYTIRTSVPSGASNIKGYSPAQKVTRT